MKTDVSIAAELGEKAFAGVVDKAGAPYWNHCLRVAESVRASGASDAAVAAALLHDAVEDGFASPEGLAAAGLSARAIALIDKMTRRKSQPYEAYIAAIASSGDPELLAIKLADNADNSDPARVALLPPGTRYNAERYVTARAVLLEAQARLQR